MKKHLPKIALLTLVIIAAMVLVFAQQTSQEYYIKKSSDNWHALIFTQNDNLYPALDTVNEYDSGAILVVDTLSGNVYTIEQGFGDWDFEVRREVGTDSASREQFNILDCEGIGAEYQVPSEKRTSGSIIKLSDITAKCYNKLTSSKYSIDSKTAALTSKASEIRATYRAIPEYSGLSDDAITLEAVIPSNLTLVTLLPSVFETNETKDLTVSFKTPKQLRQGFSVFISNDKVTKSTVGEQIAHLKTTPDWENKAIELLYTKVFNYPKDYEIQGEEAKITDVTKISLLNQKQPETYLVIVTSSDNKSDILGGAFLKIVEGVLVSDDCKDCDTVLKCLACIDKSFVDGVFG